MQVTECPHVTDFEHFWCQPTPWGDIQETQILLQYFGFYGSLKFWDFGATRKVQNAITQLLGGMKE